METNSYKIDLDLACARDKAIHNNWINLSITLQVASMTFMMPILLVLFTNRKMREHPNQILACVLLFDMAYLNTYHL